MIWQACQYRIIQIVVSSRLKKNKPGVPSLVQSRIVSEAKVKGTTLEAKEGDARVSAQINGVYATCALGAADPAQFELLIDKPASLQHTRHRPRRRP